MDYYGPNMMSGNDWGWGIFMMLFWLMFLVFIIYVVIRLLRNHENSSNQKSNPIEIAKERYAKGEIKKDEFEQLKKDLK
jgi:putative membrane protein